MNRLNKINRSGIYPVTKETLLAIEDNFQMISRVLDGLNLPNGTAVVLQGLTYLSSYMYLQTNRLYPSGKVVKVIGNGVSPSEQSSNMNNLRTKPSDFVMTPSDVKTTIIGADGVTEYPDCIVQEQYTITYSAGGNSSWKYYTLEEILGLSRLNVSNDAFSLPSGFDVSRNNSYWCNSINKRIRIDLEVVSSSVIRGSGIDIGVSGDIVDVIKSTMNNGDEFVCPLAVSIYGKVASGYARLNYNDTQAVLVCNYVSIGDNAGTNKLQVVGDIYL